MDYCVVTRIPSRSNHEMDKVQHFHVQTVWLYISWRLAFHSNNSNLTDEDLFSFVTSALMKLRVFSSHKE